MCDKLLASGPAGLFARKNRDTFSTRDRENRIDQPPRNHINHVEVRKYDGVLVLVVLRSSDPLKLDFHGWRLSVLFQSVIRIERPAP